MIVKIQISEFSSTGIQRVLIYNAERNIQWEQDINEDFIKIMNGQSKQFFFAKIDRDTKELLIGKQAPWQRW